MTITRSLLLSVTLCLCVCVCYVEAAQFKNCITLDAVSGYKLHWVVDGDKITFRQESTQSVWMGIGFQIPQQSPTMGPGDFITAWATQDGSQNFVQDRYLGDHTPFGLPEMDPVQNVVFEGSQVFSNGTTLMDFSRALDTGDKNDVNLKVYGNKFSLLWAFGNLPTGTNPGYHGTNRGRLDAFDLFASHNECQVNRCPYKCSGHGGCDPKTLECTCQDRWSGPACDRHDLSELTLPEGFKIEYFATQVPNARQMTQSGTNSSIYYVGSRGTENAGVVTAVIDWDNDYQADRVVNIASGLTMPNGVMWLDGDLYVAETFQIIRFRDIDNNFMTSPKFEVVLGGIPDLNGHWHAWKPLKYNPVNKRIYFTVGSPCNYCLHADGPGDPPTETGRPLGSMSSMEVDGSDWKVHAEGIRNSVGFDWHPTTGDIWFTDNGRDNWSSFKPYGELNRLTTEMADKGTSHYGFPFCYGYGTNLTTGGPDPIFNNGTCDPYVGAALELGPHVAPLGIRFYTGDMFPQKYKNQIFIAEHGSWNRPPGMLTGYIVKFVELDESGTKPLSQVPFISGWLDADKTSKWGRPVDIMLLADGSMLISDDMNNSIFRVTYDEKNK